MPQGRIVLKAICQSKKLSKLKTDGARLLYTWLIPNVDVNGCFSGDPKVIKGQVFTRLGKSAKTIEKYLLDLEENKLIVRYEANGDKYLCIPDFVDKQPYINPEREAKTTIPPPTQEQLKSYSRPTPPQLESKSKIESKIERERKAFIPPTIKEIKEYQKENPELLCIDAEDFFKGYNDSDPPWIDTQGKPVRNWKLKLRTRCSFAGGRKTTPKCFRCKKDGVIWDIDDTGQKYWMCKDHIPSSKLPNELRPEMKTVPNGGKDVNDRRNEQKDKLGIH